MNANMNNIASIFQGNDEDWIDEDDAPDLTSDYWESAPVTFQRNGKVICEAKGLAALREKLREIENKPVTQRGIQIRQQLAQMRQISA